MMHVVGLNNARICAEWIKLMSKKLFSFHSLFLFFFPSLSLCVSSYFTPLCTLVSESKKYLVIFLRKGKSVLYKCKFSRHSTKRNWGQAQQVRQTDYCLHYHIFCHPPLSLAHTQFQYKVLQTSKVHGGMARKLVIWFRIAWTVREYVTGWVRWCVSALTKWGVLLSAFAQSFAMSRSLLYSLMAHSCRIVLSLKIEGDSTNYKSTLIWFAGD